MALGDLMVDGLVKGLSLSSQKAPIARDAVLAASRNADALTKDVFKPSAALGAAQNAAVDPGIRAKAVAALDALVNMNGGMDLQRYGRTLEASSVALTPITADGRYGFTAAVSEYESSQPLHLVKPIAGVYDAKANTATINEDLSQLFKTGNPVTAGEAVPLPAPLGDQALALLKQAIDRTSRLDFQTSGRQLVDQSVLFKPGLDQGTYDFSATVRSFATGRPDQTRPITGVFDPQKGQVRVAEQLDLLFSSLPRTAGRLGGPFA